MLALTATCCLGSANAQSVAPAVRWITNANQLTVEVVGLTSAQLESARTLDLKSSAGSALLSVYAAPGESTNLASVPAMLGAYQVTADAIRFDSRFPPAPGVSYRAEFRPAHLPEAAGNSPELVASFQLPADRQSPSTTVSQIYPSGDLLPENLLKFYLCFSAPMRGGHVYDYIHLRDEAGQLVELPFLELDEELWNPDMTRLTLFIDPGRIKRGVKPLEEIGPALEAGKRYTLEIDAAWQDSAGRPLREGHRKTFRVGAPDRDAPTLASWKIQSPKPGTRDALTVDFPKPMDHALALRVINVTDAAGQRITGQNSLTDQERRWRFTPTNPWAPGPYHLEVLTTIEDLAGNNIGKTFEVDLFERVQHRFTNEVAKVTFEVR